MIIHVKERCYSKHTMARVVKIAPFTWPLTTTFPVAQILGVLRR